MFQWTFFLCVQKTGELKETNIDIKIYIYGF